MDISSKSSASAPGTFAKCPSSEDPYVYQVGLGNRFSSEAIPGTLPQHRNNPQKCKYGLYAEQVNGSPFVTPRKDNLHVWLYRIRPAVAHSGITSLPPHPYLESDFLPSNPKVHVRAGQLSWEPFQIPTEATDLVDGLRTISGNGEPSMREGLATHVYLANSSMRNKAFMNTDGDMLFIPETGRLDIQTELGKMLVSPGEFCVIQAGHRFKVSLPDGPSRGYIQEVFGTHFELPELGIIGANDLASPRDFEHPVAHFDIDRDSWKIIYKVAGTLHVSEQDHTPFDVVAWHGNYVPYKYNLKNFTSIGSLTKDHLDPSIWTVLTAKSKKLGTSIFDLALLSEHWEVTEDTFRPPYYHRNTATEMVGIVAGESPSAGVHCGGLQYYTGHTPHGLPSDKFTPASEMELKPMKVFSGMTAFLLESTVIHRLTDWAIKNARTYDPKLWEDLPTAFTDNLDEVNADLRKLGLQELKL